MSIDRLQGAGARSAIVIGAGMIGTAAALQMARAGLTVRLIDPDPIRPDGNVARVSLENGGELQADRVIVPAGAWSGTLAGTLGVKVLLETERGYHAMFSGSDRLCSRPIMHGDRSFFATPMEHGLRIAGTVEIAGTAAGPAYTRARVLARQARRMFSGLEGETD